MAKTVSQASKVVFGKRKVGKLAKRNGPKEKHVKKYKGQGR
jgi:hypothetical protein